MFLKWWLSLFPPLYLLPLLRLVRRLRMLLVLQRLLQLALRQLRLLLLHPPPSVCYFSDTNYHVCLTVTKSLQRLLVLRLLLLHLPLALRQSRLLHLPLALRLSRLLHPPLVLRLSRLSLLHPPPSVRYFSNTNYHVC